MFENTNSSGDEKIDNLIDSFKEFSNKRKITELDFEKKLLNLENVFEKIRKNIEIIQTLEDADALKDIKDAKTTLRSLEDLTLTDRLDIIQNKESLQNFSERIAIFSKKIDLMTDALKIFDEKIKKAGGNKTTAVNDSDLITVLDELSKIKEAISGFEEKKPIGETEFNKIHEDFEKVNTDFATLISGVREELGTYDKKIETLAKEIENIKGIDCDIGNNENKYLGMINLIKKVQIASKILSEKSDKNTVNIQRIEEETGLKITTLAKNMEKLIAIAGNKNQAGSAQIQAPVYSDQTTKNIDEKMKELDSTLADITHQIKDEKIYTNQKIANAMDAIKNMLENSKGNKGLENIDTSAIKNEIITLKDEHKDRMNAEIEKIAKANIEVKEQIKDILSQIVTLKSTSGNITPKLDPMPAEYNKDTSSSDKSTGKLEAITKIQTKINKIFKVKIDEIEKKTDMLNSSIEDTILNIEKSKENFSSNIAEKLGNLNMPDKTAKFDDIDTKIRQLEQKNNTNLSAMQKKVYNILHDIQREIVILKERGDQKNRKVIEKVNKNSENMDNKINDLNICISNIENSIDKDKSKINTNLEDFSTKIGTIEENSKTFNRNLIRSLNTIKNLKDMLKFIEQDTKDKMENFKKENMSDINKTIDTNKNKTEAKLIEMEHAMTDYQNKTNKSLEDISKVGHEMIDSIKSIDTSLETETAKTFINKLEELEKTREALKAESLNDFLIHFGEMKILKNTISEDFNSLKNKVAQLQSKVEGGLEGKVKSDLSDTLENIKIIANDITKNMEKTKESNAKKIETIEVDINKKLNIFAEEQKRKISSITGEEINEIINEQDKKVSGIKKDITDLVETFRTEITETQKESNRRIYSTIKTKSGEPNYGNKNTGQLTDIQVKINKAMKEKIDSLEKKISGTTLQIPEGKDGAEIAGTISQLKEENEKFSKQLKELKEQLSRIGHTGHSEATPIVIE